MTIRFAGTILTILLLIASISGYTQGVILDLDFYEALPRQPSYGDGGKSEFKALEGIYKIDLKPYCPAVVDQGAIASCTGWSVGYAAQTTQYAKQRNWKNQKDKIANQAFSAHFLYNQLRSGDGCTLGTHIGEALQLLVDKGNQLSKKFDKNRNCIVQPTTTELEEAAQYKIKSFATLFSVGEKNNKLKINKIKLSLAQDKPVIIAMPIYNSFIGLRAPVYRGKRSSEDRMGYHAMTVIGFDDERGAFETMNSWGSHWANKGFFWMEYDDFATNCVFAFQMDMKEGTYTPPTIVKNEPPTIVENNTKQNTTQLQTSLTFRKPVPARDNSLSFRNLSIRSSSSGFRLDDSIPRFDLGQLLITNTTAGTYLYLFSVDPVGEINIHWPRNQVNNSKFDGLHETGQITVPQVELILPEPTIAFEFTRVGSEHFYLLLSRNPINNFAGKIEQLQKGSAQDLNNNMQSIFGPDLQPFYTKNTRGKSNNIIIRKQVSESAILPILLHANIRHGN